MPSRLRPVSQLTVLTDEQFDAKLATRCRHQKPAGDHWPPAHDTKPVLIRSCETTRGPTAAKRIEMVDADTPEKLAPKPVVVARRSTKRLRESDEASSPVADVLRRSMKSS